MLFDPALISDLVLPSEPLLRSISDKIGVQLFCWGECFVEPITYLKSLIAERGADVEIHRPLLIDIYERSLSISEREISCILAHQKRNNNMIGD